MNDIDKFSTSISNYFRIFNPCFTFSESADKHIIILGYIVGYTPNNGIFDIIFIQGVAVVIQESFYSPIIAASFFDGDSVFQNFAAKTACSDNH